MFATLGAAAAIDARPKEFRTLYYPWRVGSTASEQRSLLVHREQILQWNNAHLTRSHQGKCIDEGVLEKLYQTWGQMHQLRARDGAKPHIAHPTVAESYPVFAQPFSRAPFSKVGGELFGRISHGAGMHQLVDYRPLLCEGLTAPFALFGVTTQDKPRRALTSELLSTKGRAPDVCIVDLCPPAVRHLGFRWEELVDHFLRELHAQFPGTPCLCVTGDPFVGHRVKTMLQAALHVSRPPSSALLVRQFADSLIEDDVSRELPGIDVEFRTVAGDVQSALVELSTTASHSDDPALAGTLRLRIGSMRKAMALPFGLRTAYQVLTDALGQARAEAYLDFRSPATVLAPIKEALDSGISGAQRHRLESAGHAIEKAFNSLAEDTPIGLLLVEVAETLSRKSSRTLIAFATDEDRVLGRHRLCQDPAFGDALRQRLEKGQILLLCRDDLRQHLGRLSALDERHHWKRLVVIAPTLDWLSNIATEKWLPEQLIVLSDQLLATRVVRLYQRLSSHPAIAGPNHLGTRLARIATAAAEELKKRTVPGVVLELDSTKRVELLPETDINLVDDEDEEATDIVVVTLASGRKVRVRASGALIRFDRDAELNPFDRISADELKVGQTIVVPDRAFVEEARHVLPVQVLAQARVSAYHVAIETRLPDIAGTTRTHRARTVLKAMQRHGGGKVTVHTVEDWLNVEEHQKLPPDKLRPHAPRDHREFTAFMSALNVPVETAHKMWCEGIQPLRIDRRRAGARMAAAFVSVLVDPHGSAAGLPAEVKHGIQRLRVRALDYMDTVAHIDLAPNRTIDHDI